MDSERVRIAEHRLKVAEGFCWYDDAQLAPQLQPTGLWQDLPEVTDVSGDLAVNYVQGTPVRIQPLEEWAACWECGRLYQASSKGMRERVPLPSEVDGQRWFSGGDEPKRIIFGDGTWVDVPLTDGFWVQPIGARYLEIAYGP